jgi:hypothetical protein
VKIYATIANVSRESDTSPAVFKINYMFLTGERRSDSVLLTPTGITNELVLSFKLKLLLVAHLNVAFAPLTFNISDILL